MHTFGPWRYGDEITLAAVQELRPSARAAPRADSPPYMPAQKLKKDDPVLHMPNFAVDVAWAPRAPRFHMQRGHKLYTHIKWFNTLVKHYRVLSCDHAMRLHDAMIFWRMYAGLGDCSRLTRGAGLVACPATFLARIRRYGVGVCPGSSEQALVDFYDAML